MLPDPHKSHLVDWRFSGGEKNIYADEKNSDFITFFLSSSYFLSFYPSLFYEFAFCSFFPQFPPHFLTASLCVFYYTSPLIFAIISPPYSRFLQSSNSSYFFPVFLVETNPTMCLVQ